MIQGLFNSARAMGSKGIDFIFGDNSLRYTIEYKGERDSQYRNVMMVPAGAGDGPPYIEIPLHVNETFTVNVNSSFGDLMGKVGGGALSHVTQALHRARVISVSTQYKSFGMQLWERTEPMSFSISVDLRYGGAGIFDAYKEVVLPAKQLASLVLPAEGPGGQLYGPGPTLIDVAEDAVKSVLGVIGGGGGQAEQAVSNLATSLGRHTVGCRLWIGERIVFNDLILEGAEPTFANEVDDRGYPISATVKIDFRTIHIPTKTYLESIFLKDTGGPSE